MSVLCLSKLHEMTQVRTQQSFTSLSLLISHIQKKNLDTSVPTLGETGMPKEPLSSFIPKQREKITVSLRVLSGPLFTLEIVSKSVSTNTSNTLNENNQCWFS